MKTVPVSILKARLSEYLRRVRAGEEVVVTDRGVPIARLMPLAPEQWHSRVQALSEAGLVRPGEGPLPDSLLEECGPADPSGSVLSALLEERDSGR